MTEPSNPEEKPGEDLRTRLHAMESKVRKLRDMRNMHNDEAKNKNPEEGNPKDTNNLCKNREDMPPKKGILGEL